MTAGPEQDVPRVPSRRTAGWDDQAQREPTTHIVARDELAQPDGENGQDVPRGWLARWFTGLRFVHESPGSLLDQIRWAREAAYTISDSGPWRRANIWFARAATVPLSVLYFVIWAYFTRLVRTGWALLITVFCAPVLNGIPVLQLLIPDVLDMTTWWAASVEVCAP